MCPSHLVAPASFKIAGVISGAPKLAIPSSPSVAAPALAVDSVSDTPVITMSSVAITMSSVADTEPRLRPPS